MGKRVIASLFFRQNRVEKHIRSTFLEKPLSHYKENEKALIDELGNDFLKVIPKLILLTHGNSPVLRPKLFRNWNHGDFDSYSLHVRCE